jgi:protein-S-isoprenylcysteine O-methyltransferase Ste14
MDSWGKIAQKLRVPVGTLMGIVFLLLMHPSRRSLMMGGVVALLGALLRIWAAGHIDKGRVLTRGGPYALTRNPLYLGSLLMAMGILLAGQGYWLLLPFFIFFLVIYYPVMKAEEQELLQGHGQAFLDYVGEVPFFFPRLQPSKAGSSKFLWSRVLKNREHRTVLGLLLAAAFLVLRILM